MSAAARTLTSVCSGRHLALLGAAAEAGVRWFLNLVGIASFRLELSRSKIPNAGHIERNFIMTIEEFRDCLLDYYQTEVRGEAFFEAMLSKFDKPDHVYKIGSLLQLGNRN